MDILLVVGARPQFIKAAPLLAALGRRPGVRCRLVHTGQHYDAGMSEVFFEQLGLPRPDVWLGVGSAGHGVQTGLMLERLEPVLLEEPAPRWVVVFGDTNSTLAGALAAAKLGLPLAHVEAGLRSFRRSMPEEQNRVVTDHLSDLLLCPTRGALANLEREGVMSGLRLVGDLMRDSFEHFSTLAGERSDVVERLELTDGGFLLATVHRAENTDDPARLEAILDGLGRASRSGHPVVLPLHPRTASRLEGSASLAAFTGAVRVCEPLGYLDLLRLLRGARGVATDSGGLQKEAYWAGLPCVTLRDETEWVETLEAGRNRLVAADAGAIAEALAVAWAEGRGQEVGEALGPLGAADRMAGLLTESAQEA